MPPTFAVLALLAARADAFRGAPPARAAAPPDPIADPAATVVHGSLRLTLLSPSFIRVDAGVGASNASFDDRASFRVVNRRLPVPAFTVRALNADHADGGQCAVGVLVA